MKEINTQELKLGSGGGFGETDNFGHYIAGNIGSYTSEKAGFGFYV